MNEINKDYLKQHTDILSFRDLSENTVSTYESYMSQFIEWTEASLDEKSLSDISWEEIRSYVLHL